MMTNPISSINEIAASQLDIKAENNNEQKETRAIEETSKGGGSKPDQNSDDLFLDQSIKDPDDPDIYLTYDSKGQLSRAAPMLTDSAFLAYEINSIEDQSVPADPTGDGQQRTIDIIV